SRKDEKPAPQQASYQSRDAASARPAAKGASGPADQSTPKAEPVARRPEEPKAAGVTGNGMRDPMDFIRDVVSIQPAAKSDMFFTQPSISPEPAAPAVASP